MQRKPGKDKPQRVTNFSRQQLEDMARRLPDDHEDMEETPPAWIRQIPKKNGK